jgi:type IV secretion system protein VirB2
MKKNNFIPLLVVAISFALVASNAHAAGAGMPWETPLNAILNSITGPVAKILSVIAITATGLGIAFGESGTGMKKMLWVVMGISIAFGATSFFLTFFNYSGGATF